MIGRLYQQNIGPGGELLVKRRQSKAADEREEAAVAAYLAAYPYASAVEVAEVRAAERGKDPHSVPYFDMTVDAVKSMSVLHASYRVSARQARERGEQDQAAALDARADEIEAALMDAMREATIGALEITDDPYRAMTRGQLEAKVAEGGRAQVLAPPDVPGQLRLTARAEADAWQQSADAEVRYDQAEAASAKALAGQLGAEMTRLEEIHADYESWSGKTKEARETAGKAKAELQRRGVQPQEPEQSLVEWNRQFEDDLAAVDRAIAREQQAALEAGKPWPPERKTPESSPEHDAEVRRVIAELQRDSYLSHIPRIELGEAVEPDRQPAPDRVSEPENETETSDSTRPEAISGQPEPEAHEEPTADLGEPGNRAARLDELQARVSGAAQRRAAGEAEQQARAEYVARIERQAQAEPQPDWSAERDEAEIEL